MVPLSYKPEECAVIYRVRDPFGGLSNMAGKYPIRVNGYTIHSSEALYQAMRFTGHADLQEKVCAPVSGMSAKMVSKGCRDKTRDDWYRVRVAMMLWTLRVKTLFHPEAMLALLEESGEKPIVEQSRNDDFWGATPYGSDALFGENTLGELWMKVRAEVRTSGAPFEVAPPELPEMLFRGEPIGVLRRTLA